MQSRRDFVKAAAGAAALTVMPIKSFGSQPSPDAAPKSLLELQQAFLDLRFGMFLHFNMATFQDLEWGDPTGPIEAFNPTALDTDQWAKAAVSAGMGYGCLTTKHHDGFCIWPTKTGSDHTKGQDIVRAYVDSFRKHGLRVGLYFSILDLRGDIRHFNVTPEKIARIKGQLTELLSNYGEIDMLIFDGWDAPWSRIPYDEVPFREIYDLVKKLQPNCLISELNASQYPPTARYYSDIKAFEQNAGQHIPGESQIPAQSCVTLTDGWFWKQSDVNAELKSAKQVVEEWLVPQNKIHCNLILNAAPNREGKLSPNVVARLEEIGKLWKDRPAAPKVGPTIGITTQSLTKGRPVHAIASPDTFGPDQVNDGNFNSTWYLPGGLTEGWLEVELAKNTSFDTLALVEPIGRWNDYRESRIKRYRFEGWDGNAWVELASGDAAIPVRFHAIPRTHASKVRLTIWAASDTPHVADFSVYDERR